MQARFLIIPVLFLIYTKGQSQAVRVCHNSKGEISCINDSDAVFRFSGGNFLSFQTTDSRLYYNDVTRTLKVTLKEGPLENGKSSFEVILKKEQIVLDGTPLALFYDSTLNYFVTAYTQDSGRSIHQSNTIWASPGRNFYFSTKYVNGRLSEISFNSNDWQGAVDFSVYTNGKINYFEISINKGRLKDYGIKFGYFKRETATYIFGKDNSRDSVFSAAAFKKEAFSSLVFFKVPEQGRFIEYSKRYEYSKRGVLLKPSPDILTCDCD